MSVADSIPPPVFQSRFPAVTFEGVDGVERSVEAHIIYVQKLRGKARERETTMIDRDYRKFGGKDPQATLEEEILFTAERLTRWLNHRRLKHLAAMKALKGDTLARRKRQLEAHIAYGLISPSKRQGYQKELLALDRVIIKLKRTQTHAYTATPTYRRERVWKARRLSRSGGDDPDSDDCDNSSMPLPSISTRGNQWGGIMNFTSLQNIPDELKSYPQWVLWRAEPRDGRVSKIPYRLDGQRASSTRPDDWASFGAVCRKCASGQYSGAGFVFRAGGGFVGIDLDHVIGESGDTLPWVQRMLTAFNSYAEFSVSGTGLHIICRGMIPDGKGRKHEPIEVYDRGRYFTMSGYAYGSPRPLRDAQAEINRLLASEWMKRDEPKPQKHTPRVPACPDDRHLLHRAASSRNGYKFARLWQGDTSDYGGDDSRADIALLSMLMFWTNGNEARADALFRQSGLNRPKWECRKDYRRRCFDFLAGGCGK